MRHIYKFIFIFLISGLISCVAPKSFIASSIEPVVIENKGEKQLALSIRPFKYYQADFAYATSDKTVLKCSAAGFLGFGNFMVSALYNKSFEKIGIYIGSQFSYQVNNIDIASGNGLGTVFSYYSYNCEYYSPGALLGFTLKKNGNRKHHLILKTQYNIVSKYGYNNLYAERNYSIDNENLNYRIQDFMSFEIYYAFLLKFRKNNFLKLQLGSTLTQKTYSHSYSFNSLDTPYRNSGGDLVNRTTAHPVSWPVNLSVGFIFSSKKEPKKIEP